MSWRVALIDSCGFWRGALDSASFTSDGRRIEAGPPRPDVSGHGSRIAELLAAPGAPVELLLGQVFVGAGPTCAASVSAAVDWAVDRHADLIHMSFGLSTDMEILRQAIARACAEGALLVASVPARGGRVFPAAYDGVIRGTGDARCKPGEISCLERGLFGGCARLSSSEREDEKRGGASIGAAWISKMITRLSRGRTVDEVIESLDSLATHRGRERITAIEACP
jgi:hypothetical protein